MREIRESLPSAMVNDRPIKRPGHGLIQDIHQARRSQSTTAVQHDTPSREVPAPSTHEKSTRKHKKSKLPRIRGLKRYLLIVVGFGVIAASMQLSDSALTGEVLIGAYGLLVLFLHIPSRITFWIASMVLVGIGAQFLLVSGVGSPNTGALFVFLLLGIGLISSVRENRRPTRRRRFFRR